MRYTVRTNAGNLTHFPNHRAFREWVDARPGLKIGPPEGIAKNSPLWFERNRQAGPVFAWLETHGGPEPLKPPTAGETAMAKKKAAKKRPKKKAAKRAPKKRAKKAGKKKAAAKTRYYTVKIPASRSGGTRWHPRAGSGPVTRGAFKTRTEAHAWAARNIPGYKYSVVSAASGRGQGSAAKGKKIVRKESKAASRKKPLEPIIIRGRVV